MGERLRVLCVDDEEEAAFAAGLVLLRAGFDVRVCRSGPEALEAAEEFRPEAAVLDLEMPGMTGEELARRLRGQAGDRPLRLVALTGLDDAETRARAREAGISTYLLKPVDPPTLLGAVTGCVPA
jgi:CheY-like chemotaxis protein